MIRYYTKEDRTLRELEEPQYGCWVNISPPFSHEELEELSQQFDIPLDFLTDSLDIDERSRYEREDDIRLIVVNTPILNEIEEENDAIYITVPIGIILTPDQFITITAYENPVLQLFLDGKVRGFNTNDESAFVLQIMEQNVYRFLTCLKKLNLKRNLIEKELYDSSRNKELKQLLSIEKSLVYFVNSLSANELLKMKMKRTDFLKIRDDEDKSDLFEDIIIDNSQALEMANIYTNILNGTMDAYGSIISNNLNITIRRLTLITIILMVPTLVASFYGMNIPLPLEGKPYALPIIVAVSISLSLLVTWYFQRKRLF
ncbi:magnesium transporter CorA family protein [Phaeodactylibacter sp.]|jgi:magnesium transporter|uniref:magnesium transporter CorA family protein n=1 Tax=Phaeodactylibacter sp. TaxID=1940289 RepID=UPI0025E7B6C9|nr:magnesium transporter CorA family protein [Phaeodactylibacter sp.]MCI4650671.1 magnesium transporter CorA family protein [Phaeodactylibacter sp.]MCI5092384.1 magnesium transporter CorA family protein [Phaeodactylibacter sp.]